MKKIIPLIGLLASGSAVGVAQAGQGNAESDYKGPHFWVSPALGYFIYDSNRQLKDSVTGVLGLEYRIDQDWGVEFLMSDTTPESEVTGGDVDLRQYRIDGLYYLELDDEDNRWQPYAAAGLGRGFFEGGPRETSETQYNFGGGVRYNVDNWFAYRADIRGFVGDENDDLDTLVSIGFTAALGGPERKARRKAESTPLAADDDGDGISNLRDKCPNTPEGVQVDRFGCALDSDEDGVPDYRDKCLDTPQGVEVDATGCKLKKSKTVKFNLNITFDFNSAAITSESAREIEKLAAFLKTYKELTVNIEGHTDSLGPAEYNKRLSIRRARAVADRLIELGVEADRVSAQGFGEERPVASNDTEEGRAQNRRVVTVLEKEVVE